MRRQTTAAESVRCRTSDSVSSSVCSRQLRGEGDLPERHLAHARGDPGRGEEVRHPVDVQRSLREDRGGFTLPWCSLMDVTEQKTTATV